jgi:hypothetical protein
MTIIYIENLPGSGKTVKVVEDFGDYAVHRDLAPGEHACIGISRLKNLQVQEVSLAADGAPIERRVLRSMRDMLPQAPASLERRVG